MKENNYEQESPAGDAVNSPEGAQDVKEAKSASKEEFAAVIGIDWAKDNHQIALWPKEAKAPQIGGVSAQPEALEKWAKELRERFGGQRLAVVLETRRGPLAAFLLSWPELFALFPLNPLSLKRYRETWQPSGAISDKRDCYLLAEIFLRHRERFERPYQREEAAQHALESLCRQRRDLADRRTALGNELSAHLEESMPQALELFGDFLCPSALKVWRQHPSLEALKKVGAARLRRHLRAMGCTRLDYFQEAWPKLRDARPLLPAVLAQAAALKTRALAGEMTLLDEEIATHDKAIAKVFSEQSGARLFENLPGAGEVLAPRLLCALALSGGEEAGDLQCLSGIAPVRRQSGRGDDTARRLRFPQFLHQSFMEFAHWSARHCDWARAFVKMKKDQGWKRQRALRALAFKWIRILHACWRDQRPYDDKTYLASLAKRNPKLYQLATTPS